MHFKTTVAPIVSFILTGLIGIMFNKNLSALFTLITLLTTITFSIFDSIKLLTIRANNTTNSFDTLRGGLAHSEAILGPQNTKDEQILILS